MSTVPHARAAALLLTLSVFMHSHAWLVECTSAIIVCVTRFVLDSIRLAWSLLLNNPFPARHFSQCAFWCSWLTIRVLLPLTCLHRSSSSAEDALGRHAEGREKAKVSLYKSLCETDGWRFVPTATETSGTWGPDIQKCIRDLVRRQGMRNGRPP